MNNNSTWDEKITNAYKLASEKGIKLSKNAQMPSWKIVLPDGNEQTIKGAGKLVEFVENYAK